MWTIRRAGTKDRVALIALCHAAVGEDDYVPDFLGTFLKTGVVLVAWDGRRAIGMMVYDDVPDGSAWLHAARTHPRYRRQGVATALMSACEDLARRRHRTAMRLWASQSNRASVRANRKYGYEERARFSRMRVVASSAARPPCLEPMALDADGWSRLETSSLLRKGSGYLYHDFYFLHFDRVNAQRLAREAALWRFASSGLAMSADVAGPRGKVLEVQPLFGSLRAVLRACPALGAGRGADRVESFLPHDPKVLKVAKEEGFEFMEWGREAILFEKPVHRAERR